MPKLKRTHLDSRSIVCIICRSKIFKKGRVLNNGTKLIDLLRGKYELLNNYDPGDMTRPNALCPTCCSDLYNSDNDKQLTASPPLLKACAYININAKPEAMHTRACSTVSACDICQTAQQRYKKPHQPCLCPTCTHYNNIAATPTISPKPEIIHEFSTDNLLQMQSTLNLSNVNTLKLARSLRSICGRSAVEPGFRENLVDISNKAKHFYSHVTGNFHISKKDGYQDRVLVYCHDIEEMVSYVLEERKYDPFNHIVRIGLDGGGGFFKIVMNVIDTTSLHTSGIFKDTGVKSILLLAVVEDISELYSNLVFILSKIQNLDRIKYHICSDIKLINTIVGIQSCAGKHPCPYCKTIKIFYPLAEARTLGSIRHSASAYTLAGSKKKLAQLYTNCANQPLITGDDDEYTLNICAPPQLHIMQGIVKHVYDRMYEDWSGVKLWLTQINIKQKKYHRGAFVGNDCIRMLKNVDRLQQIAEFHNVHIIQKYVHILRCLYDVVKSCFGMKLDVEYEKYINIFQNVYKDLGISTTPKVHILIKHVPEFIKKHNRSLGWYSEQALETTHYDFKRNCWEKQGYKRNIGHPDYAQNLMSAVIGYTSKNIS